MTRLAISAAHIMMTATFAVVIAGCNRVADTGTTQGASAMSSAAATTSNGDTVKYAKVVSVDPVRDPGGPHQVCRDETVTRTLPPRDEHRVLGTAIGAVAGGLLGNQVGHGRGRTLATVAGAVGGGYAGNRIQANRQHGQVVQSVQHRCSTVNDTSNQIVGYDVHYLYNGVTRTVRMDHDPGDRVQIQEGVTAVSDVR
ncbi:glycine zipper 2TM domain-containing protein [Rhodanobacter sp. L36]|uniref:glycine zipper 2TM domain-containing protein n=1 Tax=Rhodanobacter sp. L36 TaxID=1747221 RepID=UPI00131BD525|nr:glycine zipper 2TM domain-containing protein [Rhodanobacter sp. L36]